jgi:hypothetical protein
MIIACWSILKRQALALVQDIEDLQGFNTCSSGPKTTRTYKIKKKDKFGRALEIRYKTYARYRKTHKRGTYLYFIEYDDTNRICRNTYLSSTYKNKFVEICRDELHVNKNNELFYYKSSTDSFIRTYGVLQKKKFYTVYEDSCTAIHSAVSSTIRVPQKYIKLTEF